jgi:hypothetical protein
MQTIVNQFPQYATSSLLFPKEDQTFNYLGVCQERLLPHPFSGDEDKISIFSTIVS